MSKCDGRVALAGDVEMSCCKYIPVFAQMPSEQPRGAVKRFMLPPRLLLGIDGRDGGEETNVALQPIIPEEQVRCKQAVNNCPAGNIDIPNPASNCIRYDM